MNSEEQAEKPLISKYFISNENYMPKIKNMFTTILKQLNENNKLKSSLVNLQDFDQKILFEELDNLKKGYLNSVDIADFLKKFTLDFSEQLIRRLIQHYDKKTPYKLYFEDFNALITPKTIKEEENSDTNKVKGNRDEIFLKVLKNEFKLIVKYHEMIVDIKKCDNFITYEAFISISEEEKNIDNEKLKKFLGNNYSDEDIKNLLYYLDMDNDGLLTYDEFEDFFASMPVSQEDINYMNNEEIKYAMITKEKVEKEINIKNNEIKYEKNDMIINKQKEENINIKKNNVVIQNKIEYEENMSQITKVTKVQKNEVKYDNKNIYDINKENINIENINIGTEENNIIDNINIENDNMNEKPKKNNKIIKKINYNNKNLLRNDKEIIEYETYMKNRYLSTEENIENNNNIINKKRMTMDNKNNLINRTFDDDSFEKNINHNQIVINKKQINRKENNIINNKKYEVQIKSNIINNKREFYYYNSPNDNNNDNQNDIIKDENMNENNQLSSSYKIIDNSTNNKENIENIEKRNSKKNQNQININNNNNDINNLFSGDDFSGNLSSTDFNKSENFINENNINNNIQQKNEIEIKIQNKNENNIKKTKINNKIDINNDLNIERENLEYIQDEYNNNSSEENKEEDLYIQKNTNIEIKKENNIKNQEKNKILMKNEIKKETNNIRKLNIIKNENINNKRIEMNNSINNNSNSENSHTNHINVNGSLFTCGGNGEQEKITLKPGIQENEKEDYKYKISSIQTNNDLVTQIKSEYKMESPFSNINKNLNDVFSKEMINKNKKEKDLDYFNSNNKYFYFQDKAQKEENEKLDINNKNMINNENIYINKMKKEEIKINNVKNLNMNKVFKEQIHEEREDYLGDFSENKYKYLNEKYIFENNNLKNNLELITSNTNNLNIFSNEKITQKTETSDNDDYNYTPNNEQTIHDLSNIININSDEYNFSSKTSINIFLDYIDNILKLESTCLILKESLALREDITFKELFCLFDYHKNKNISIHEFKKVCKNTFGLYPTTDQVRLIFRRYDINKDEKLDLKEFLNMISPIKKEYVSVLFGDKRIQKPFKTELSEKSKKIIENLTKAIILNETNYYEIREKMRINNFNKNEVWNILMQFSKNKNYLNRKNFDKFLKAHSYYLTSYEIDIIFNKFDFDKDAHFNFDDFKHEFHY